VLIDDNVRQQFLRDGAVLLPGALSAGELERCYRAWRWSRDNPGPAASGLLPDSEHAFQDLCNPDALVNYRSVVEDSPLADYAKALWQSDDVWFMYEQVFHKSGGDVGRTPWHQDTSYLAVDGAHLIAFWISFESIPAQAGLEFVRGSHRGPLYNTSRFDPTDATLPIFESDTVPSLPDIEADRSAWDILSFDAEAGDVIAFHTSTLHGGGAVDPTTPERRTLTLRFFGDDAISESRPGQAGPFYSDIRSLQPGEPFRHARVPLVRRGEERRGEVR
jgi:ectoine hydroxylase-related dioxygenase (phytanoyl-CoA dioxygenase family)